jgi:tetratricopeptide (TPR) repeat protein
MRYAVLISLWLLFAASVWAQTPDATPAPEATPAPTPAQGEEQLAKKVRFTSPIDGGPVDGWQVETFVTSGVDSDFCYLNASASCYQKLIATDPRSGYTGYAEDFLPNLKAPLPQAVIDNVKKKLPKMFNLAQLEPWDRYAIVAQIYIWRKMPAKDIGNAYLRATYTMRGLALGFDERKREIALRKLAIKYLLRAQDKAEVPLAEIPQLKYLIGDLYRRNGEFKTAIRYFDDAAKIKNRPEWLDELLIRQKARAFAWDDR